MQLQIIAYVMDTERSAAFYESLGFERQGPVLPRWVAFRFGETTFALHGTMTGELDPPSDRLTINVTVPREELDQLHALCQERGYDTAGPIADVGFGPHFRVLDPDGLPIQFTTPTR